MQNLKSIATTAHVAILALLAAPFVAFFGLMMFGFVLGLSALVAAGMTAWVWQQENTVAADADTGADTGAASDQADARPYGPTQPA